MRAFAAGCGDINRTYLSGVERSERDVSIDNIARIARGPKVKLGCCWMKVWTEIAAVLVALPAEIIAANG